MKVRCPNCQIWHTIEEPPPGWFENRIPFDKLRTQRRPSFKTDVAAPAFPQPGIANEQPAGLPGWDSHVKIPLRQAMISGLLDAPAGLAIGLGVGLTIALTVDLASKDTLAPIAYILITGGGAAIGGTISFCRIAKKEWPKRLSKYDALLWAEDVTGFDLDGDGEVGEPAASRVEVEIQEKGIPREIETLEIDLPRLQALARLIILDKEAFSQRTAAKAGISRDEEWIPLRDKLITRRWAAWKIQGAPTQGVVLKPKGEAIFKALLSPALGDGSRNNVSSTHPPAPAHQNYERFEHIEP